jgi:hypothetical protein
VASRATSAIADPGASSSRLPGFAWPRCLRQRPTTAGFTRRCIVRINEHGSKDRVKDASRFACDGVPCLRPVPTLRSVGRRRSPPRLPSDIRCHRRARYPRRKPLAPITSRPRPPFQRRTAKHATFQKTGMPFAATTHEGELRGEISLSGLRAGSLAHAAHTFSPGWGECFVGHCKCHGAVTRDP